MASRLQRLSRVFCDVGKTASHKHSVTFARVQKFRRCSSQKLNDVYVYQGRGTTEEYFRQMYESLTHSLDHKIQPIDANAIQQGDWKKKCAAIVFGGGHCPTLVEALGSLGVSHIQDYVVKGGFYLGVSAGAHLACEVIPGHPEGTSLKDRRPMDLYPGVCVVEQLREDFGPPEDGQLSDVVFSIGKNKPWAKIYSFKALVKGGGMFVNPLHLVSKGSGQSCVEDLANLEGFMFVNPVILVSEGSGQSCLEDVANFEGFTNQPAVVKTLVGQGMSILCSPHLELPADGHDTDETNRVMCWKWILRLGGLSTATCVPVSPSPRRST